MKIAAMTALILASTLIGAPAFARGGGVSDPRDGAMVESQELSVARSANPAYAPGWEPYAMEQSRRVSRAPAPQPSPFAEPDEIYRSVAGG